MIPCWLLPDQSAQAADAGVGGTFPTTPLLAALLTGVVVIVVGLTYFPVIALGPSSSSSRKVLRVP
jgi:K+-transporting ATPase A subunit